MNAARVTEHEVHAYLDRELDPVRMLELEALLARDQELAAWAKDIGAQGLMLHAAFDGVLGEPLPRYFERALRARSGTFPLQYAALGASLALGTVMGWLLREGLDAPEPAILPRQAAVAHAVFSPEVRHPVEVDAGEEAHLVAWLSKRLGARVRAPQLRSLGYELLGGRLLPEAGRPSAQFMYESASGRRVTLYVGTDVTNRDSAFRYWQEGDLHVFYWIDRELGYALAGDIEKEEMRRIARAVYEQLER
jgi:anti-sigma factor RsiW